MDSKKITFEQANKLVNQVDSLSREANRINQNYHSSETTQTDIKNLVEKTDKMLKEIAEKYNLDVELNN